ncbi:MAG: hypothetical protein JJ909_15825 [Roseivirga sp.]|uniref:hypothetical protein n=1 Tax=Roseivirga sp. TaxID=1964215 RepID=UPI001B10820A|nr:hypothetical protein [Roseivirga sp.]MBO6494479.1 hypothetical protein [Roseivirga sp.]MBO6660848.1 hypothetical protein [Roseivirga sp.]MBO6762425.1 hypothetical protein [Roseivirga sp.]MBO6909168.1 hypothetical protein [Roseivirga sp.]
MPKQNYWLNTAFILSAALTIYIGYFVPRESTVQLISAFTLFFGAIVVICKKLDNGEEELAYYWGMLLRVLLIASVPKLSDDIFRFVWDGRLLTSLEDPYKHLPAYFLDQNIEGVDQALFAKLNSKEYFSVYPPLNQVIFFIGALFSPNSIIWSTVVIRIILLLFELGNIRLIQKLLAHYGLPQKYGLIYALNPLVILELTGNLHFEAIVIFFLLQAVWYFERNRLNWSAVFFGLSVATKFIPLIALPLLIRKIGFKKTLIYGLIVVATLAVTFLPMINTAHAWAIWESMSLYFQKFEFNGSFYYLARWYGFEAFGHNIIEQSGKWMMAATFVSIIIYSLAAKKSGDWPRQMVWVWLLYLLFATTVHPWYAIPLLAVSVFSNVRFPFLWSYLIFLTYINYSGGEYQDRIDVVMIEYGILAVFVLLEIFGVRLNKWLFSLPSRES